jgi:hypothetical protein
MQSILGIFLCLGLAGIKFPSKGCRLCAIYVNFKFEKAAALTGSSCIIFHISYSILSLYFPPFPYFDQSIRIGPISTANFLRFRSAAQVETFSVHSN